MFTFSLECALAFGSPRQLERAMVTARGMEGLTGINAAGHRHIRSSYYSGTRMALEDPWGMAKPHTYLALHAGQLLVDFNGSPQPRQIMLELADGLLAHRQVAADGQARMPAIIRFADDREVEWRAARSPTPFFSWHLFWGAWKWTGEHRYLKPIFDQGLPALLGINANALPTLGLQEEWAPTVLRTAPPLARPYGWVAGGRVSIPKEELAAWQLDGDKSRLEKIYTALIESCDLTEYINTEGSLWSDRVGVPTAELQRMRLGGVALLRSLLYPGHAVSWQFRAPADERSVAILIPDATPTGFTVVAHNLDPFPVHAVMTGWTIEPGSWEITQGIDRDHDDLADGAVSSREETFERSRALEFTLPPQVTSVLTFRLKTSGVPYWSRPDLGIDPEDVVFRNAALHVRVHSLGSVPSPAATLAFRDRKGRILASAPIPPSPPHSTSSLKSRRSPSPFLSESRPARAPSKSTLTVNLTRLPLSTTSFISILPLGHHESISSHSSRMARRRQPESLRARGCRSRISSATTTSGTTRPRATISPPWRWSIRCCAGWIRSPLRIAEGTPLCQEVDNGLPLVRLNFPTIELARLCRYDWLGPVITPMVDGNSDPFVGGEPAGYDSATLPEGVRSRLMPDVNGLSMHILEAGFEQAGRPLVLLLHGFPELAFSWRCQLSPLARCGYYVVAPDMRGYGRTTSDKPTGSGDLASFSPLNLAADVLALLEALGHSTAALVGHDFGSRVAAWTALKRPDVVRGVVLMSAPFDGAPVDADGGTRDGADPIDRELAGLPNPKKYYQSYFRTREANDDMWHCSQGVTRFLRAYFHMKSADWPGNRPYRLRGRNAAEMAKMPAYYVMDLGAGMAETVAPNEPTMARAAACRWLSNKDLAVYAGEFGRTGFQGGLQWYRAAFDRMFRVEMAAFAGRTLDMPACFIAGEADWGMYQAPGSLEKMQASVCRSFLGMHIVPAAGHWVQQEQPLASNELLRALLATIRW